MHIAAPLAVINRTHVVTPITRRTQIAKLES